MPKPLPDDCIAAISVRLFTGGAMQISGNVGDKKMALQMLAAAVDAVRGQVRPEDGDGIIIPSRDVEVTPHERYPLAARGDLKGGG